MRPPPERQDPPPLIEGGPRAAQDLSSPHASFTKSDEQAQHFAPNWFSETGTIPHARTIGEIAAEIVARLEQGGVAGPAVPETRARITGTLRLRWPS